MCWSVVGIQRWAGEALEAYQQNWNQAVTSGLRPLDRMLMTDDELSAHLAPTLKSAVDGGGTEAQGHFSALDPSGRGEQRFEEPVKKWMIAQDEAEGSVEEKLMNAIGRGYLRDEIGREGMLAYDKKYGPGALNSKPGLLANALLANPVAAYGLPAAGVGMAALGIHDVLTAQQRAEKEGQLPLQGGVQ